jgi:pimeloyl-ACP methyl ester carboxylesterase
MTGMARTQIGNFVDVEGLRTFYLEKGEGPTIVLMHGSSVAIDSRVTWFRNIDALSENFRVFAFDQPGFGYTDMPHEGRYLDRQERTRHALDFLDVLGLETVILVGHSEGGYMGTRIAIEQPDRVAKLIVVTSGGTAPRLGGDRDLPWMAASKRAYDFTSRMAHEEIFLETAQNSTFTRDEEFMEMMKENYSQAKKSGNFDIIRKASEQETKPKPYTRLQEEHIHPFLPSLAVPTLLVWANNDGTVPVERGLRLMELIVDCEMHVFDKARHMVMVDQAEKFSRLLLTWCGAGNA